MTNDNEFEKLFSTAVREFNDNGQFLAQLSSRLDKVEYIKRLEQVQKRSGRTKLALAFAAGALAMLAALILFPFLPTDIQIISHMANLSIPAFFSGSTKFLSTLLIAAFSYALAFNLHSISIIFHRR